MGLLGAEVARGGYPLAGITNEPAGAPQQRSRGDRSAHVDLELPGDELEQVEQSYLLSCSLVNRVCEQESLHKHLLRVLRGKGAQVVLDGASGLSKTRLLHELCLEAQLGGMLTLKADAQASPEPFGVPVRLGLELILAWPEHGRAAAEPHAALLAQLSELLRDKLGEARGVMPGIDSGERRARVHAALHEWFVRVAMQRPLLIAVDNVQAADPDPAAFLASLGHAASEHRILLFVTQRSGERPVAHETLRMLRTSASCLRLDAFSLADCEALVCAQFGDVPNAGRLAKSLFERSAGNPGHCIDMAQLLVRKRIVKYLGGIWVLPQALADGELPNRVEELITARLAALGTVSRELIERLSVDSAPASIERCFALSKEHRPALVNEALDQLVTEQFLIVDGERADRNHERPIRAWPVLVREIT
jgi:predicted ATPase